MLPGREMSRIQLTDILNVVRRDGETGSHSDPIWNSPIEELGSALDAAVEQTLADQTLAELLDRHTP